MSTIGLAQRRAPSPPGRPAYLMPRARLQHLSNVSHASTESPAFCSWKARLVLLGVAVFFLWQALYPSSWVMSRKQSLAELLSASNNEAPTSVVVDNPAEKGYLIVGVRDEPEFSRTVAFSWRLKEKNPSFVSRALAFPSIEKFQEWAGKSQVENVIPDQFKPSEHLVAVFKDGKFIGASAALRSDAYASGLVISAASSPPQQQPQKSVRETKSPITSTTVKESLRHPRTVTRPLPETAVTPPQPPKPFVSSVGAYLPVQVTFKNKIITGYRSAEGKSFTNYKPFASVLTADEGWQFMYQAPLMASIILVQDQTSASNAMIRYPKAMINNIGWGGQSCLGGTKGAQIKCRSDKAQRDGCTYESLKLQPPQNRLWIPSECRDFFENKCKTGDEGVKQLWIQKPSGGQHGVGMKVHQGCESLRNEFAAYCGEASSSSSVATASSSEETVEEPVLYPASKKKYFIMPYLQPALLDGHKFDVRSFGLIASLDPLLVFYADGFVRRATTRYSTENLHDETAHITNSVKQDNNDDHFWDFERLSTYLNEKHGFPKRFMSRGFRQRAMRVTEFVFQAARQWMKKRPGRFQLFACDWIVDSKGGVHLLEVNSNPLVGSTPYPGLEHQFPAIWKELMDLVVAIQTSGTVMTSRLKKFEFCFRKYWWLCLNELEEKEPYNSCKVFQNLENPPAQLNDNINELEETALNRHPAIQQPKSLEEIQRELDNEARDDQQIEQEENDEQLEANGGDEETISSHHNINEPVKPVPFIDLQLTSPRTDAHLLPCPHSLVMDAHRKRCTLAAATEDETFYYVISSDLPGPLVVVIAGVHGNEGAGVVAARHVAKHWKLQRGTLVVLERANPRGVAGNLRFVPASHDGTTAFYDLNRAFPLEDPSAASPRILVREIWMLMSAVKPDLFFDLHEGRAFFAASSQAASAQSAATATGDALLSNNDASSESSREAMILENVGSTTGGKVSKGNSIVTSHNADHLARVIADACNENVDDMGRKFLIMAPPISGGLASKVHATFNAKVMLFETTLVFPLETRVRQHLFMLSVGLRSVGVLPADFDFRQVGGPVESCVATRKGCPIKVRRR